MSLAAAAHPPAEQDAILAVIRALLALAFVAVAPLWSAILSRGADLLWVYPGLVLLAAGMCFALWALPPKLAGDIPSGQSIRASIAELARGEVVWDGRFHPRAGRGEFLRRERPSLLPRRP